MATVTGGMRPGGRVIQLPSGPNAARTRGRWLGTPYKGVRIYQASDGTKTAYLRLLGKQHKLPCDPDDRLAIEIALREFQAAPESFNPRARLEQIVPVRLDSKVIDAYLEWCGAPPPGKLRPRNSAGWISQKGRYLQWLAEALKGKDLRGLPLDDLAEVLNRASNYKHTVETIKHLYSWLRSPDSPREWRVKVHDDPTYAALKVPQGDPAEYRGEKQTDFTPQDFQKVVDWLEAQVPMRRRASGLKVFDVKQAAAFLYLEVSTVRAYAERGAISADGGGHGNELVFTRKALDAFDENRGSRTVCHLVALANMILAGTAWHVTEVCRFGEAGRIDPLPRNYNRRNGAHAVLVCDHKGGFPHPTPVTEEVARVAQEFLAAGGVSYAAIHKWTKKAVDAVDVPKTFRAGRYRHNVLANAEQLGDDQRDTSKFAGHRSETTTRKHYTATAVPPKIVTFK